jgi:hypothetical protein
MQLKGRRHVGYSRKVINNCPTYGNRNMSRAQSVILEVGVVVVVMNMVMMKLVVFQLLLGTQVTEYKSG